MDDEFKPGFSLPSEQQTIRNNRFHPRGAAAASSRKEIDQTIPGRLENFARLYPNRIAVKSSNTSSSWDQLNRVANRIGQAVLAAGEFQGRQVALLLDREALITASLGVLKAGGICVPLSPDYPLLRHDFVLKETEPNLILTNNQHLPRATELAQSRYLILNVDEVDPNLSEENLNFGLSGSATCFITYTSGSTGEPKGVVNTHQKVIQTFIWGEHFNIDHEDRFTDLGSGLRNPFSALLNGASLFPWSIKKDGFAGLSDWLIQEEISVIRAGPRVLRHFVSGLSGHENFSKLRGIILAGEPVFKSDVELYKKNFPAACVLVNVLGAHEVGPFRIFVINKSTEITGDRVPAGYEIPGKEVLILDDDRHEKSIGEIGEIGVVSCYPSLGYWRKPALTETSFVADRKNDARKIYLTGDLGRILPDGCLEHLGRKDFRVKISGYTVDVSEVENALTSHPGVREVSVITRPDSEGDSRLIAYFVANAPRVPTVTSLRNHVKELLPIYMVPSVFVKLNELPHTKVGTGKIDRCTLPEPGHKRPNLESPFIAPTTALEKLLAQIWAEVLILSEVGTQDNFFELGGNSLSAIRIIARVMQSLPLELSIHTLLDCPTIGEMAALIMKSQSQKAGREDLERALVEVETMSEDEARRVLAAKNLGAGR